MRDLEISENKAMRRTLYTSKRPDFENSTYVLHQITMQEISIKDSDKVVYIVESLISNGERPEDYLAFLDKKKAIEYIEEYLKKSDIELSKERNG